MTQRSITLVLAGALAATGCGKGNESEHAGKPAAAESAGTPSTVEGVREPAAAEHAGKPAAEHGGAAAQKFDATQIEAAMTSHINAEIQKGGGAFRIKDEKTGQDLALKLVGFHTPREIRDDEYFLCTDFRAEGAEEGAIYDLDFWLVPKDGALAVTQTRIHKHPVKAGDAWNKQARYKFVDDEVVEIP